LQCCSNPTQREHGEDRTVDGCWCWTNTRTNFSNLLVSFSDADNTEGGQTAGLLRRVSVAKLFAYHHTLSASRGTVDRSSGHMITEPSPTHFQTNRMHFCRRPVDL